MKTIRILVLIFGLSVALIACVTGPTNNKWVTPHSPIHFSGYASQPGVMVEIRAYNKLSHDWVPVGSAISENAPANLNGDTLYFWHTDVLFTSQPQWQCFWGSDKPGFECLIPPGSANAQVKVRQVGLIELTTFESGFFSCISQKFGEGKGGIVAGYECRSSLSPILNLKWLT